MSGAREREARRVGLCVDCAHGQPQPNARGNVFWRCRAAEGDPTLLRYPPLPVLRCHAHAPATAPG